MPSLSKNKSDRYLVAAFNKTANDSGTGGGVTDHGALTGLLDDDHTQYHNDARGDARYYTQSQVDTSLAGKANTSHTHPESDVTNLVSDLASKLPNTTTLNQINVPTASVDFNLQQSINFRVENRTSDPASPSIGQIWLRTDL